MFTHVGCSFLVFSLDLKLCVYLEMLSHDGKIVHLSIYE